MRDLYHNVAVQQALNPVNSTTAKTSSAIDLQGFSSATVIFALGTAGDTLSGTIFWTLKIQDSDDNVTYNDVLLPSLVNGAATYVVDSLTKDETAYSFAYVGNKRYLKGIATPTGSHTTGTPIGILALKSHASLKPVI